jgi:hypothetical protein
MPPVDVLSQLIIISYVLNGLSVCTVHWLPLVYAKIFSFFSFWVLQLMLPEAPQPYGLLYYPHIGHSSFLHQFRAVTPPKQRKLEL